LPDLNPVNKEQPTKEFVGWKGKTSEQKRQEDYPPALWWIWNLLIAGYLVFHPVEQALVLEIIDVFFADQRFGPIASLEASIFLHQILPSSSTSFGRGGAGLRRSGLGTDLLAHGDESGYCVEKGLKDLRVGKCAESYEREVEDDTAAAEEGVEKIHPPRFILIPGTERIQRPSV
jgi:hypothetical protein